MKNLARHAIRSVYGKIDPERKQNCFEVRFNMFYKVFIDIRVRFPDRQELQDLANRD
jgi:hypothetical protein